MKIHVLAGEASGDLHGARLIENLKKKNSSLEIYGAGGDKIKATGARDFVDLAHFHVTGFTETLRRLPQYRKAARTILSSIRSRRPDLVVLIDNPGFNLFLARRIHALGVPIVYYIAPQIWAWAPRRILKIKRRVQKVLVVFEFEKELYEKNGIPVAFVGHPLKDLISSRPSAPGAKNGNLVSLLPGSRKSEVRTLLPIFLKAAEILSRQMPSLSFALIQSPTLPWSFYEPFLNENPKIRLVGQDSYGAIGASDLAVVCSGTATLECALLGVPIIISNRASLFTYLMAKNLIRVKYLGLPNLILGKKKFPELLQYDATPKKIADEALKILSDENLRASMKRDLKTVSDKLGAPGASSRAADEILKMLG